MKRLFLILSLACALPAAAQRGAIWRWTDASGALHYTDDPSSIPEAHRAGAVRTEGAPLIEVDTEKRRGPRESHGSPEGSPSPTAQSESSEEHWRDRFAKAWAEISELEAELERERSLRDSAPPIVGGIPRVDPRAAGVRERIAKLEEDLARARSSLEALDREASEAAVPRSWRDRPRR